MAVLHAELVRSSSPAEESRKRFLEVLSRDLPGSTFSWRRQAPEEDAATAKQRKETALEEMRRRMDAMCSVSAPLESDSHPLVEPLLQSLQHSQPPVNLPPESKASAGTQRVAANPRGSNGLDPPTRSDWGVPLRSSRPEPFAPNSSPVRGETSPEKSVGVPAADQVQTSVTEGKREQFLSMLAQHLGEAGPAPLPRPLSAKSRAPNEVSDEAIGGPGVDSSTPADLGPNFFAEVEALQERLARRRASSREASARCSSPLHGGFSKPSSPRAQDEKLPRESHQAVGTAARLPEAAPNSVPVSNAPTVALPGRPPSFPPPFLRPPVSTCEDSGSNPDEDDDILNTSSNDELLRWADEVLKQAAAATSTPAPDAPPRVVPRPPAEPCTAAARERRRRAENLRGVMRRLTAESEQTCDRLAADEELRRRHMYEQQKDQWRERINCAAEEMRSNFASGCSFERPVAPSDGAHRGCGVGENAAPRGASVPPPRPPGAPSSGPRPAPRTPRRLAAAREVARDESEASWARLEERLDRADESIHFCDIPWPATSSSITGAAPGDSATVIKQKLAGALRRWHPDKWRRILDRVPDAEQAKVMERVKNIAQRLLDEKVKLTCQSTASR